MIPDLMSNTNNKELVSQLQKSSTVISNAYKQSDVLDGISKLTDEASFKNLFVCHLKLLPGNCGDGYDICLADGSRIKYGTYTPDCTTNYYTEGKALALKIHVWI